MRILYLHQHFTTREGSSGTRSYEFSRLLIERGHTITLLAGRFHRSGLPHEEGKLVDSHNVDGIQVLTLNVPYDQKMSYFRRTLAFIWFMLLASWVALRQRKVDVIFATSTPLTIAVPAIIAATINRKPFVFEVRDLWPEVPIGLGILHNRVLVMLARALEKFAYRRANHIIALSPGMKEGIIKTGISPDKVTVIPNACDNPLFDVPTAVGQGFRAQHPEIGDRPLVVYTGAFGAVNDLNYLVKVAACVKTIDPTIGFLLVGVGSETEKIRALSQECGLLGQNLWMMEEVPKRDMPAVLSAATLATSIFLPNPVMWTNSANKFFDALAAGKPIAINYGGWQADVLRESGAGIVLDAENIEHAATQLVDALHTPDWLTSAGQASRQLAQGRFARDKLVENLERVLVQAGRK
jgi:glycosyltransferase involved in cell wall biosynthesis